MLASVYIGAVNGKKKIFAENYRLEETYENHLIMKISVVSW